jgi:hypothetical protein
MPAKLKEIETSLSQLLLDPNNPRFTRGTEAPQALSLSEAAEPRIQDELLKRFLAETPLATDDNTEADTISVQDLRDSFLRIGYVPIDKIVVRKTECPDQYLVIEGNRRVAALKSLFLDFESGATPFNRPSERAKFESHRDSYTNLAVLELDTTGMSPTQALHSISIILGIRHHGSVLEWDPLPRAFNIYSEYRKLAGADFASIDLRLTKEVASRLCISAGDVKQALRAYIAYLQLRETSEGIVRNEDFSLIQTAVTNKSLVSGYLKFDQNTYQLDGASIDRLITICQFGKRDRLPEPGGAVKTPKKIIPDVRVMRRLGQIIQKRITANSDSERSFIDNVVSRIENENDPLTVDEGLEEITAYLTSLKWREAIANLLSEQEEKLTPESYAGTDNERGYREEAQHIVGNIVRIMGIDEKS